MVRASYGLTEYAIISACKDSSNITAADTETNCVFLGLVDPAGKHLRRVIVDRDIDGDDVILHVGIFQDKVRLTSNPYHASALEMRL